MQYLHSIFNSQKFWEIIKNWISRIKMWGTVNLHLSDIVTGGYELMRLILHCTALLDKLQFKVLTRAEIYIFP